MKRILSLALAGLLGMGFSAQALEKNYSASAPIPHATRGASVSADLFGRLKAREKASLSAGSFLEKQKELKGHLLNQNELMGLVSYLSTLHYSEKKTDKGALASIAHLHLDTAPLRSYLQSEKYLQQLWASYAWLSAEQKHLQSTFDALFKGERPSSDETLNALNKRYRSLEKFERSLQAYKAKDWQKVIQLSTELTQEQPGWAMVYSNRGRVYAQLGQYEQAKSDFTQAIRQDPRSGIGYFNRGALAGYLGDYAQAMSDLNLALRYDKENPYYYNNRGFVHLRNGDYEWAVDDFNTAIALNPYVYSFYSNRGEAFQKLELWNKARFDYDQAIQLNPVNKNLYFLRGTLYFQSGNSDEAIDDFSRAEDLGITSYTLYLNRARAYANKDVHRLAESDYNRALSLNSGDANLYRFRGETYWKQGRFKDTVADYSQWVKLDPSAEAYFMRGKANLYAERSGAALRDFQKAMDLKGENRATLLFYRGMAYRDLGQCQRSMEDFRVACGQGNAESCNHRCVE